METIPLLHKPWVDQIIFTSSKNYYSYSSHFSTEIIPVYLIIREGTINNIKVKVEHSIRTNYTIGIHDRKIKEIIYLIPHQRKFYQ